MFRKVLFFILPLVLFTTFGSTTLVNAEPFTASGSMQVLNLEDCNLSVKYNADKMRLSPITTGDRVDYFIGSYQSDNVFLRASCSMAYTGGVSTPARVPFWTGPRPDYTKIKVQMYGVQKSGMVDGSGALLYNIENKQNPSKSILLVYNYNTSDFGSWSDVYNGVFASQAGINNDDLQLKYINDPVYPADVKQEPAPTAIPTSTPSAATSSTNSTPITASQTNSANNNTTSTQTTTVSDVAKKTEDVKPDTKTFTFDSSKYVTCSGKTGKYLNSNGEVIKASQIPKRASLIKADANGVVLSSENDYISCVKNAKVFGVVNCKDNVGNALNNRGQKVRQYIRGAIYYASPEFGNVYVSSKAGVMCTDNQFLLAKAIF